MLHRRDVLKGTMSLVGLLALPSFARAEALPGIAVWKDPWCGCCSGWMAHLETSGFAVEATDSETMDAIKAQFLVPPSLHSCHTAKVAGYVIEGHVPAPAILRLLRERPPILGLAVPGMPMGSPGMEGPDGVETETYDVLAFSAAGIVPFMRFKGPSAT